jgi:hypothetical protein
MAPESKMIIEKVGKLLTSLIRDNKNAKQELKKLNDEINGILGK